MIPFSSSGGNSTLGAAEHKAHAHAGPRWLPSLVELCEKARGDRTDGQGTADNETEPMWLNEEVKFAVKFLRGDAQSIPGASDSNERGSDAEPDANFVPGVH